MPGRVQNRLPDTVRGRDVGYARPLGRALSARIDPQRRADYRDSLDYVLELCARRICARERAWSEESARESAHARERAREIESLRESARAHARSERSQ